MAYVFYTAPPYGANGLRPPRPEGCRAARVLRELGHGTDPKRRAGRTPVPARDKLPAPAPEGERHDTTDDGRSGDSGRRRHGLQHTLQSRRARSDRYAAAGEGPTRVRLHQSIAGDSADALLQRGHRADGVGQPAHIPRLRARRGQPVGVRPHGLLHHCGEQGQAGVGAERGHAARHRHRRKRGWRGGRPRDSADDGRARRRGVRLRAAVRLRGPLLGNHRVRTPRPRAGRRRGDRRARDRHRGDRRAGERGAHAGGQGGDAPSRWSPPDPGLGRSCPTSAWTSRWTRCATR